MAEIRQSKVNKTLILSTRHIFPVTPIITSCTCSCWVICYSIISMLSLSNCCAIFPSRLMISLEQWRSTICCFFPVVGCELNVNTRMCKHDVTRFISLAVSFCQWKLYRCKSMYSGPTVSCVNHMKWVLFILNMH